MTSVTFSDLEAAAARLDGVVVHTPSAHSVTLSAITGAEVWIKFEHLQYTASFKERGARNRLDVIPDADRAAGVVTMSAGNHAQALAHHATILGMPSVVVMPENTPLNKVSRTEENGAEVVLSGATLEEAAAVAHRLVDERRATFVPPYDDAFVVAGQGTCTMELLADMPSLDVLVVPVGGGGLFAGACVAARALSPDVELIGVQSELYPSMLEATGRPLPTVPPGWGPTIAEGIAVKRPGGITKEIIERLADDLIAVPESAIEAAVVRYLEIEKVVAEGAGAAPLGALLADPDRFAGRRVGLIMSGANIDLRLLSAVIMRGLARTGRLARFVVDVPDLPGGLADLTSCIGEAGGNIVDLWHHREFGAHSARVTEIELLLETRDDAHERRIRTALEAAGYGVADTPHRM